MTHRDPSTRHRIPLNPVGLVKRKTADGRIESTHSTQSHDPIVRCAVYSKGKIVAHDADFARHRELPKE